MTSVKKENPFYNNYVFSEYDKSRCDIKWWEYPFLFFLRTLIQINDGYVFYFKMFGGRIYLMKIKEITQ